MSHKKAIVLYAIESIIFYRNNRGYIFKLKLIKSIALLSLFLFPDVNLGALQIPIQTQIQNLGN